MSRAIEDLPNVRYRPVHGIPLVLIDQSSAVYGIPTVSTDFELRQGGHEATRRLLELPKPPTAMFASSDLLAVGALRAIHEAGLSLPDAIAVVSFDGTSGSEFSWPRPQGPSITLCPGFP